MMLFVLGPVLRALEQKERDTTATEVARAALSAFPAGKWEMTGVLETRISQNKKYQGTSNECSLRIEFQPLGDGGYQVTYERIMEDNESEDGVRVVVPQNPVKSGLRILDLRTLKPIEDVRASLFGSLFSLEDVAMRFLSWKNQSWKGSVTLKDRECFKLESLPGKEGVTRYSRVESWIDRQYGALLKALAYDAAGGIAKEFNVRSFQKIDDVWMLKMLEVTAPEIGRSRLEITNAERRK